MYWKLAFDIKSDTAIEERHIYKLCLCWSWSMMAACQWWWFYEMIIRTLHMMCSSLLVLLEGEAHGGIQQKHRKYLTTNKKCARQESILILMAHYMVMIFLLGGRDRHTRSFLLAMKSYNILLKSITEEEKLMWNLKLKADASCSWWEKLTHWNWNILQ